MGENITVRQFQPEDREAVRQVCLETSSFPLEKKGMKEFILTLYNDYYTEAEPENCFVAENEDGKVIGYLLCARNFDEYYKIFKGLYLPQIKKLGVNYYFMAMGEIFTHKAFSKKYPAHLHIDLTTDCRRKGVGTKLMNALKAHLKAENVDSLMLSCGLSNKSAISFYKKNGFDSVCITPGGNIMACKF